MSLLRTRYQNKRYRLKGYTTASRVEDKYRRMSNKNKASHVVTIIIVIAAIVALWIWIRPISLLTEIFKTLGFRF